MRLGSDFGGITQPIVSVGNIRHADDTQLYLVGGINGAAFHCSSLFL